MSDPFASALAFTLQHEGGYVNDPADPGGATRYGISQRSYPGLDIAALTIELAADIYRRDFWCAPGFAGLRDATLAARLFDLGVNCGTRRAAAWLQVAANLFDVGLKVDGVCGPTTVARVNAVPHQRALLAAVKHFAAEHYIRQQQPRFLAGWLNRLES